MKAATWAASAGIMLLSTGLVWGDGDDAREHLQALRARARAKITMLQALQIAMKEVPAGQAASGGLEMEGDTPVFEFVFLVGDGVKEVEIDAVTGKVIEVEDEPIAAAYWCFDRAAPGRMPDGWSIRQTNASDAMATWQVVADASSAGKGNVLACTKTANYGHTFNLAIAEQSDFTDLDLTVRVKALTGKEDQGGGPIWRCRDENNYYICRFNPLEGNYRVYVVKDGKRRQLQSAKVETHSDRWYTVRTTMVGNQITCYFDGKRMLEAKDDTFANGGRVGLWTKADAVASFDDLAVAKLRRPAAGHDDDDDQGHQDDDDDDDRR